MKVLKLSVISILLLTLFAGTQAVEVVLQNGKEYNGCEDSYINSRSTTTNYGTDETLAMLYELCSS